MELYHKVFMTDCFAFKGDLEMYVGSEDEYEYGGTFYFREVLENIEQYDEIYYYASKEDADVAIVEGKIGERDICVYPSKTTLLRLETLNSLLTDDDSNVHYSGLKREGETRYRTESEINEILAEYGLAYPITLEELMNNMYGIYKLMNNRDVITNAMYNVILRRPY